jgi:hypothetical protein
MLYTANGIPVSQLQTLTQQAGYQSITIIMNSLPAGVYTLYIKAGNKTYNESIIKK